MLFTFCGLAQDQSRVEVKGNITVPSGFDAEGITIYNQTSNRGAVSSENGDFLLKMKSGDSLVFSAIQFRELKIRVGQEVIDSRILSVEISEGVNELPEIVIRPHDLSGNIEDDLKNIETAPIDPSAFSYKNLKNTDVVPDDLNSPGNAAMHNNQQLTNGLNIKNVVGLIGKSLFPKKKSENNTALVRIDRELRARYSVDFFNVTLGIREEQINDFISFAEENGLQPELLKKDKEMDLLQLLIVQSERFREQE